MIDLDKMCNDLEEFMEDTRESAGINVELQRCANLSNEEIGAIEWFLLYSPNNKVGQINHVSSGFKKVILAFQGLLSLYKLSLNKTKQTIEKKNRDKKGTFLIVAILLLLFSIVSFSKDYVMVDPNDGTVFWVHSEWWGFSKNLKEIRWRKVEGYDYPAWMARAKDGSWYPAIYE